MTEDRSAGREEFVTRVLAAAERERHGRTLTSADWFVYAGTTYRLEVSETLDQQKRIKAWDDNGGYYAHIGSSPDAVEGGARAAWDVLEAQRTKRLARGINPLAVCDGGKISCGANAVWAFKANSQDGWMYACGRHLTWSMTEELGGEQGVLTVRRIATEER